MNPWNGGPCTARELAGFYKCTYRIFKGHLKRIEDEIGTRVGHYYTVKQVLMIIERLGPFPDSED